MSFFLDIAKLLTTPQNFDDGIKTSQLVISPASTGMNLFVLISEAYFCHFSVQCAVLCAYMYILLVISQLR